MALAIVVAIPEYQVAVARLGQWGDKDYVRARDVVGAIGDPVHHAGGDIGDAIAVDITRHGGAVRIVVPAGGMIPGETLPGAESLVTIPVHVDGVVHAGCVLIHHQDGGVVQVGRLVQPQQAIRVDADVVVAALAGVRQGVGLVDEAGIARRIVGDLLDDRRATHRAVDDRRGVRIVGAGPRGAIVQGVWAEGLPRGQEDVGTQRLVGHGPAVVGRSEVHDAGPGTITDPGIVLPDLVQVWVAKVSAAIHVADNDTLPLEASGPSRRSPHLGDAVPVRRRAASFRGLRPRRGFGQVHRAQRSLDGQEGLDRPCLRGLQLWILGINGAEVIWGHDGEDFSYASQLSQVAALRPARGVGNALHGLAGQGVLHQPLQVGVHRHEDDDQIPLIAPAQGLRPQGGADDLSERGISGRLHVAHCRRRWRFGPHRCRQQAQQESQHHQYGQELHSKTFHVLPPSKIVYQ